jgi:hypothetical protein
MMKPPRRPRGEKPAITIRIQARQIKELQQIIDGHRLTIEDKNKVIAGYDVQLSEANDDCSRLRRRCADQAIQLGAAQQQNRMQAERLAFLEGYYAKSQETAPKIWPIRSAGALVAGDTAKTHTGGRPHYPQGEGHRPAGSQSARPDDGARWPAPRTGSEVSGEPQHNSQDMVRGSLEHIKITEPENWNTNTDGTQIRGQGR